MNSFDKVIGYKSIKRELLQICDMIRNRTIYEKMGARLPHGLLLYGDPGLGKSLLANCFMEECGLNTVTVRRDKGGDAFINCLLTRPEIVRKPLFFSSSFNFCTIL